MRLRKNMKRTAAAVLALSMAVSAVAAPASAAYICDVSQGSVEVSVNEEGEKPPPPIGFSMAFVNNLLGKYLSFFYKRAAAPHLLHTFRAAA